MDTPRIDELDLVDTRIAARILGLSSNTLVQYRYTQKGPPFYRIGPKTVRYAISDLNDYAVHVTQ